MTDIDHSGENKAVLSDKNYMRICLTVILLIRQEKLLKIN